MIGSGTNTERPLRILLCSGQEALHDAVQRLDQDRTACRIFAPCRPASSTVLGLIAELRNAPADLVLFDESIPGALIMLVRALGWRTILIDNAGASQVSVSELAIAAGRPGAGLDRGPDVSVIATVLNERETVDALVDEVLRHLAPGDELIVADGGSTDGTLERLFSREAVCEQLQVLVAPGANISAGRNVAIRAATKGVIVCADAGCHPGNGWLSALRMPFGESDARLGLVAGVPSVLAVNPLEAAQAAACYPDPFESKHPTLVARLYTTAFGTAFQPEVPFARFLAFTKEAWERAGGFPEDLGWVEDGAFGLAVARNFRCALVTDGEVTWRQRRSLRSTFRMYRDYGIGAFQSGDPLFLARDGARAVAYIMTLIALMSRRRLFRAAVTVGAAAYISLPVARAKRQDVSPLAYLLIPVALVTKDIGKLCGEAQAALGKWRKRVNR